MAIYHIRRSPWISYNCLAGWLGGWLLAASCDAGGCCLLAGSLASRLLAGWLAAGLPGWLQVADWLAGCWQAGRPPGWLAGWLAEKNGPLSKN